MPSQYPHGTLTVPSRYPHGTLTVPRHMSQTFNHDARYRQSYAVKRTQRWSWRPRQPRSMSATQLAVCELADFQLEWSSIISDHRGNAQKTKQCLFCVHSILYTGGPSVIRQHLDKEPKNRHDKPCLSSECMQRTRVRTTVTTRRGSS